MLAGVGKMSRRTFITYNVIGAFVWVFGVTLAGYVLADVIGDDIDKYLLPIIAVIIIAVADPAVPRVAQGEANPAAVTRRRSRSRSGRARTRRRDRAE